MILFIAMLGCSVKGTVELMKAERAYDLAEQNREKKEDVFYWTTAEQYLLKAREEYANSNFEQAAILAKKSQEALGKMKSSATEPSSLENKETSGEE